MLRLILTVTLAASLAAQSLHFEENRGQVVDGWELVGRAPGLVLGVAPDAILFARDGHGAAAIVLELVEGASNAAVCADGELPGRSHYFRGRNADHWVRDVRHHAHAQIEGAWPGVTLRLRASASGAPELDIFFDARTPAELARFHVHGAVAVRLLDSGDLALHLDSEEPLVLGAPVAMQEDRELPARFVLKEAGAGWEISFEVDGRDPALPLWIDPPMVAYATYLGGSNLDDAHGVAIDASGNLIVTGETSSTDFPLVSAWSSMIVGGPYDAFTTKIDPMGNIIWSTYWGGDFADYPDGCAVDDAGNVYVVGHTQSTAQVPAVAAWQPTFGGGSNDGFAFSLDASGSTLRYSSYFGGSDQDICCKARTDSSGALYIVGHTGSSNLPTTPGAAQTSAGGSFDAFLVKVAPGGGALDYCTYIAGSNSDFAYDVDVNAAGVALVSGRTDSPNFPLVSPTQGTRGGGDDAFVMLVAANGGSFLFSTYLGGSQLELAQGAAFGLADELWIAGTTYSSDFPTVAAPQPSSAGGADAFLARWSPGGAMLELSTHYGGSGNDQSRGAGVDMHGNVWIGGVSTSSNLPVIDPVGSRASGDDYFIASFDGVTAALRFGTLYGGSSTDHARDFVVSPDGIAVVIGQTRSTDLPTVNPLQAAYAGGTFDGAIVRLEPGGCAQLCGDCNQDGQVTILDAFEAARHAVGLITLTGLAFEACNVVPPLTPSPAATLDVRDALEIARATAGLVTTLVCC